MIGVVCTKCKLKRGFNMNYCPFCGTPTQPQANGVNDSVVNKIKELEEKKNFDEIAKYALSGNAFAEYVYYYNGFNEEKIKPEAERNNIAAIAMLGIRQYWCNRPQNSYFGGSTGGGENYEKAIKMVQKAAEMKDPAAMSIMGEWFASGNVKGISKNEREAYKYTKNAADLGNPSALYRLGKWHLEGTNGVSKTPDVGQALMEKAAYYGIPNAVDWVKKKNEKWFDTDIKIEENKETEELSIKFLNTFNKKVEEYNIKKIYENNISAKELVDFDFYIQYKTNKRETYKAERARVSQIVSNCNSLNECVEAWDTLKKNELEVYDATVDMKILRQNICKIACINIEDFEGYIDRYFQKDDEYVQEKDNPVPEEKENAQKQDVNIEDLIEDFNTFDDAKRIEFYPKIASHCTAIENGQIVFTRLYCLLDSEALRASSVLHNSGSKINKCSQLDNINYSFQIPMDEPIYLVNLITGSSYNKKACGYAITSTGIYVKSEKKEKPTLIKWNDYITANIYLDSYSKKTMEKMLVINESYFPFKFSRYNLDFLLELKRYVCFVRDNLK